MQSYIFLKHSTDMFVSVLIKVTLNFVQNFIFVKRCVSLSSLIDVTCIIMSGCLAQLYYIICLVLHLKTTPQPRSH